MQQYIINERKTMANQQWPSQLETVGIGEEILYTD